MPLAEFGLILGFNLSTGIVIGQFWHFCLADKAEHLSGYILFLRRILRRNYSNFGQSKGLKLGIAPDCQPHAYAVVTTGTSAPPTFVLD